MQMNKLILFFKITALATIYVVLLGCTVPQTCYLFNNTDVPVEITKYVSEIETETYLVKPGEVVVLAEWEAGKYELEIDKKRYWVDPSTVYIPNVDYVEFKGFGFLGKRIAYLQLDKRRLIYLLKKDERFPVKEFSNQPEGFPIKLKE